MRVSEGIWTCWPRVTALSTGSYSAAGCGADGCAFASAEDATEDGSDGCAAADLLGGVFAAALAFHGVGFGGDGDALAAAVEAGELDGEQGGCL